LGEADGKPTFEERVATSGLVPVDDLTAAVAALREASDGDFGDEQLADYLVERGLVNRWQAGQILRGRVRFHLGPYRIIDAIGQGGMGQVFQAEHTVMKRVVAVKVLPLQKSTSDTSARFQREIQAQAQLDHANLVRALDAGHDGNVDFLVTEFVRGTDLRQLVRTRGKLPMAEAASIIWQAAHGLAHAHAKGLIHRDIKPGNLLVTPEGLTKISDLGLVGFCEDESLPEFQGHKIVGTADYLSPEQITRPETITPASDIYALGCTLYYAVTGKVPFPGGTVKDKARKHLSSHPLDPRRLNPELDDDFVDLIADMMAKDVAARIDTAEEVIRRVSPWVRISVPVAAATMLHTMAPVLMLDQRTGDAPPGDYTALPLSDPNLPPIAQPSVQQTDAVDEGTEETVPMFEPGEVRPRWSPLPVNSWMTAIALLAIGSALGIVFYAVVQFMF